jgi:DNA-binding MarR family transcriptional regulator
VTTTEGSALSRLPGYVLAQAFRMLRHAMDDTLREIGLTTPQWGTLACLDQAEGLSGADIARIHHLTPQTMNTILHNLEQGGLILREPHPTNGTVLRVSLTEDGKQRIAEGTRRVEQVHRTMLSDMDEEECGVLMDLLGRCIRSLEINGNESVGDPPCLD